MTSTSIGPGDALYHHSTNNTALEWEVTYEDPTVGGLHPTDLGHTRVAEFYQMFRRRFLLNQMSVEVQTASASFTVC